MHLAYFLLYIVGCEICGLLSAIFLRMLDTDKMATNAD